VVNDALGAPPMSPAATVLILREASEIARAQTHALPPREPSFEVLLIQRGKQLAFHGGAWAFPGGRVEAEELCADELGAARRAAQRETLEEIGVVIDPDALTPFSHWTTPNGLPRRFATWFFVTCVAADLEVRIDGREAQAHCWLTPREALVRQAAQGFELPPPTFVSLSVLSRFDSAAEVVAAAARQAPFAFVPRPRPHAAGIVSLYQGDVAYEDGDLAREGPRHRLNMLQSGWEYLRDDSARYGA
jgi:8-oxo-dGTP pyrophosphatase MutT (NUDIX family)